MGMKIFTEFGSAGRNTAWRVVEGIANSQKMVVICGAGISAAAGIPVFRLGPAWNEDCLLGEAGAISDYKPSFLFGNSSNAKGEMLADINMLMTRWRILARKAPITAFHGFLHRAMDEGRVAKCVTRNFDGLETRDRPDLEDKVLMVHGDNRVLTCEAHDCTDTVGDDVPPFDNEFLSRRVVQCPGCCFTRDLKMKQGKRVTNKIHELRSAVQLDENIDPELQVGYLLDQLLQEIKGADLLLVAGTCLKTTPIRTLFKALAHKVHSVEGAVIFIEPTELDDSLSEWVDFCLQMDVQRCAEAIIESMNKQLKESAFDIWQELWERDIPGSYISELPVVTKPICSQCAISLADKLFPCAGCGEVYCFETPYERMGRMCVSLDYFAEDSGRLPFEDRINAFLCPACFQHDGITHYPHFIRRISKFYQEPQASPRLVLVVFYLSQFWPLAESLISAITSAWRTLGWPCYIAPVKLQMLEQHKELLADCTWEAQSFNILVVFLTHGMSGSRNYQLADNIEASPTEFLEATLKPISKLVDRARTTCGYLLTCGHVYLSPDNICRIQEWVDTPGRLTSLVGTMNKRLSATYMINFIAQSTVSMLGYRSWNSSAVLDAWLRDTLASSHSDLIYFGRNDAPRVFYFSPFQTRPLGKDLPNLLTSCKCTGKDTRGKKKIWKVTHNGEHNMPLGRVVIVASCTLCETKWRMHEPMLPGRLHKVAGLYAAEVPYFDDSSDV